MVEKQDGALSPDKILGSCFLRTHTGFPITGAKIVEAVLADPRPIKNGRIRMRVMANFIRDAFTLGKPNKPSRLSPSFMNQNEAFLATTAIYALETAGILMRTPYGYDKGLRQWDVQLTAQDLSPRVYRKLAYRFS